VLPLLEALDVFVTLVLAVVMACTLGGPCVYFAQREVVSVDGLAHCASPPPLVASHARLQVTDGLVYIDELFIKRYVTSLSSSSRVPFLHTHARARAHTHTLAHALRRASHIAHYTPRVSDGWPSRASGDFISGNSLILLIVSCWQCVICALPPNRLALTVLWCSTKGGN
jgi:hypothetical protein